MAKMKKEDTKEYKEQAEELQKTKGTTEYIEVGKKGQTAQQVDLQDLILNQTELWYKNQVMQILIDLEKQVMELREEIEMVRNDILRK